jgi:hypothetical protein
MLLALGTFLAAIPVQLMAYTATCTQGDVGPFLTGVVFSTPLLFISLACLIALFVNSPVEPPTNIRLELGILALASVFLLICHRTLLGGLWNGQSACGAEYGSGTSYETLLIATSYGLAPLCLLALAFPLLFKPVDTLVRISAKKFWQMTHPTKVGIKRSLQFYLAAIAILPISLALQTASENLAFVLVMIALIFIHIGWSLFLDERP